MYKKLQYTDVLRNIIIIYEHNNLLKLSTIFLSSFNYDERRKKIDTSINKYD